MPFSRFAVFAVWRFRGLKIQRRVIVGSATKRRSHRTPRRRPRRHANGRTPISHPCSTNANSAHTRRPTAIAT
ncbi:hypothetical protein H371_021155, partial [Burkholderia pseudomallei CB]|nr:hypothetical protein [Burkholderia pseudomallei CB]